MKCKKRKCEMSGEKMCSICEKEMNELVMLIIGEKDFNMNISLITGRLME